MVVRMLSVVLSVVVAVLSGIGAALALAVLRGGDFGHELGSSLWIVGALMLLIALFSFSPSTRRGQDELLSVSLGRHFRQRHREEGGAGLELGATLALAAVCMFGIALLYG